MASFKSASGDLGLNDKAGHVTCGVNVGHEVGKYIQAFGVLTLKEANSYLPQYVQYVSGHGALCLRIKWALISPIPTPSHPFPLILLTTKPCEINIDRSRHVRA